MRGSAVLAVALLVALAGCNAAPGGDGTTTAATTSEATRDGTATGTGPGDADPPPGVSASGVTDPDELVDAHDGVLRNTSYTVESNVTVRGEGALLARTNATVRVAAGGHPAFQRYRVGGERPESVGLYGYDVETWHDGNATWYATDGPNGTDYRRVPGERGRSLGAQTGRDHLHALFTGLNATVAGTETRDGATLHRLGATRPGDAESLVGTLRGDEVANVSLTALVGEDGVVHRYRVGYDATVEDSTVRVERAVRFTALGETTVERPAWYDEAANATGESASTHPDSVARFGGDGT